MKKTFAFLLIFSLSALLLCGCAESKAEESSRFSVVTTIFPEYDWVRNVLGDKVGNWNVRFLLDTGVDLHSFQPGVDDIITISDCDLFVYVGGESDSWVKDALKEATNPDMIVLNLMDVLGESVKEEEVVEGMQAEDEEEEDEACPEYDEHIWLSLRNAETLVSAIAEAAARIDQDNAAAYAANAEAYCAKLAELDRAYLSAVENAGTKTFLFADRFPFRYLADDYGLDYYAAFVGCSAESEASFETVLFLASKVDELALGSVLKLESSDGRIAETVIDATEGKSAQILSLDSMQSTTKEDVEQGADYLAIMEKNLEILKAALQ